MRWLPRSLLGRVYALYALSLVVVAGCGLALFLWQQVQRQVNDSHDDARTLLAMVAPTLADAAVIGDYDAIGRQLQLLARQSTIETVRFRDPGGATLQGSHPPADGRAPRWLVGWVGSRLDQPRQELVAGGVRYGDVHLQLAAGAMAEQLWQQALVALALAALGVGAGLLVIQHPLQRWLGPLERIGALERGLEGGRQLAHQAIADDAPVEFRRTFEVLGRAAQNLQEQRERAAATLQAIDDVVLTSDPQGRVVLANDAAQRLFGRPAEALVGSALHDLLPALADDGSTAPRAERWQHRRLVWRDDAGVERVLDSNLSPVLGGDGSVTGQVLACRDVTEQHRMDEAMRTLHATRGSALVALRRALEAGAQLGDGAADARLDDLEAVSLMVSRLVGRLQERGEQLDAIFALSPDGFVSFDGERRVRYCSPGFVHLTGLPPEMVVGLEEPVFLNRLRSRCASPVDGARIEPLFEGRAGAGRTRLTLAQPARQVIECALHGGGNRSAVQRVLHLRDVTRETEVDRLKSEFVAAAAHELRTPMVGIYGYSELLVTRDLPPERAKPLLSRIHRQCEVMVDILNEMLDLARMEARQGSDFDFAPTTLDAVVQATLADFCPPPERDAPQWQAAGPVAAVHADRTKMQRALRNLLSNAYKYSPRGGAVTVGVCVDAPRERVAIEVVDQGIGMTPEQVARVGERFYRADESGSVLGTGLGMSLVREIVSLHGGSVELRSAPGRGTTALLWLPMAAAQRAAA